MNIVLDHLLLVTTTVFLCITVSGASPDANLCYLKNGQSSEAFTVPENTAVGSDLGVLQFVGNADKGGDIQVFVTLDPEGKEPPATIRSYTQTLVLNAKLDKEEETGISNFVINVSCHPTDSTDPDITIPVRIIVTDANDNAPKFKGTPYVLNVSEVTVIGTTVMTGIRAEDKDQHGPLNTVEYYLEKGPNSHLLAFENPLEGSLVLTGLLDFETLPSFTVTIRAQDQGHPPQSAFTTLTVNVLDADDQNPRFLAERYIAHLPPNARSGTKLEVSPQSIKAEDTDIGIQAAIVYSFDSVDTDEYKYFTLSPQTGSVYLRQPLPEGMLLPVTLVIRATQVDNRDRYALTTLTVASDKPLPTELKFTQPDYVTTVLESTPPGQVVLTVQTTKTVDKNVQFQLLDVVNNTFAIRESGEIIITESLDYETTQFYAFRVAATDGKQSDIAKVNITVMNVNDHDPTFNQSQYSFSVPTDDIRLGYLVGKIEVFDKDLNDEVELSIKGPFARVFSVYPNGEIRISDTDFLNSTVCHLTVVAVDNGSPPRQASVPVTVQFPEEAFASGSFLKPRKEDSSYVLLIVFGALLATLLVVSVTLAIYILKSKQYRDRLPSVLSSATRLHNNNKVAASYNAGNNKSPKSNGHVTGNERNGVENPIFNLNGDANTNGAIPNGRTVPRTHTETNFISAWSNDDLLPVRNEESNGDVLSNGQANKQNGDSILKESKIQNIHWPNGSIPRRVKKLSWEDERFCRTELDPDVSVAPLGRTSQGQPDLTVYF